MIKNILHRIKTQIRIKAFAMIYSIVVLIFISIICSSFIMLMYYHKLYVDVSLQREKLKADALSGINYFLCSPSIVADNETKTIELFDDENNKVELTRKKWGIFDLILSKALWQKHSYSMVAITGDNFSGTDKVALYLTDRNKPLGLCGDTKIKGTCYLPKAGVERTYIEGENFIGSELISGTKMISDKKLPVFNEIKDFYAAVKAGKYYSDVDSVIEYENFHGDTIVNSFIGKTIVLYSANDINLDKKFLKGNIKVVSGKSVKVTKANELQDIIIFAPYINFSKEFSGRLQAYAGDSLSVDDETELNYPSVLGLIDTRTDTIQPYILMKQKSKIAGLVFLYSETTPAVLKPYVKINKDALVCGQLISSSDIQLQGTVNGSVYCNRFILKTPSSYYENDLLDAMIDYTKLPKEFVGFSARDTSGMKKIVKWLF